jgi:hypothetical protein
MGLGTAQVVGMGGSITAALVCVAVGLSPVAAVACLLLGLTFSLVKVSGQHLHSWAGALGHFVFAPRRWRAPLRSSARPGVKSPEAPAMPTELGDVRFLGVSYRGGEVGLATYRRPRDTLAWTLAVEGPHFRLASEVDQARAVAGWGEVLAGSARERSALRRLQVIERAVADPDTPPAPWLDRTSLTTNADALAVYRANLAQIRAATTRHEVFVTGVVEPAARGSEAIEEAVTELGDVVDRMEGAGFRAAPLGVHELATLVRATVDPAIGVEHRSPALDQHACERLPDGRRIWTDDRGCLWVDPNGDHAPGRAPAAEVGPSFDRAGPMARDSGWAWVRTDSAYHALFEVTELPRVPVGPEWAWPLVVGDGLGAGRTLAIHLELSPPTRALRRAERSVMGHEDDDESRQRWGFRSGVRSRREAEAARAREEELVAGYADARFAAVVGVSAPTLDQLERSTRTLCQQAVQARLELRRLYGQQDLALGAILPLGRCRLAGGWG